MPIRASLFLFALTLLARASADDASPANTSAPANAPAPADAPASAHAASAGAPATEGAAVPPAVDPLLGFLHNAEAQRNRVDGAKIPPVVASALLEILARGVRSCDCHPRRLRWAWALPLPKDRAHPAIVVSFTDPPRDQTRIAYYMRFAFLRFHEGRYVVTSTVALRRPALSIAAAKLVVHLEPRRDVDEDGQLDIALTYTEQRESESSCGKAQFGSATDQLVLREEACAAQAAAGTEPDAPAPKSAELE